MMSLEPVDTGALPVGELLSGWTQSDSNVEGAGPGYFGEAHLLQVSHQHSLLNLFEMTLLTVRKVATIHFLVEAVLALCLCSKISTIGLAGFYVRFYCNVL